MHVAVIYSKPSKRLLATPYGATDEDSAVIAREVGKGLQAKGMQVTIHPIAEGNIRAIAGIKADCIFNIIEWCGLDIGLAQRAFGCLRELNIPVTGATEEMFVLTGDKIRTKQALEKAKIPTPRGAVFVTGEEAVPDKLPYPVIVKPAYEHCSTGLGYDSIAYDKEQVKPIVARQIATFRQPALAEEFIVGREFLVYLLEEKTTVRVLPIEEAVFTSDRPMPFQTYEAKWDKDHADYKTTNVVVAKLSAKEKRTLESVSIRAFKRLGLRGYARFDVRMRDGIPYILETNANPSVYDAEEELTDINQEVIPGITFPDYLLAIVESAQYHYQHGWEI